MNCESWRRAKNSRPPPAGLQLDQNLRHHGVDIDDEMRLIDRPIHAEQANAVLVSQSVRRPSAPGVARWIDIVDLAHLPSRR